MVVCEAMQVTLVGHVTEIKINVLFYYI